MEHRRIIKGNNAVIPTGAEVLGAYSTNAVTDGTFREKGNQPISNEECVIESRVYMIENKK